MHSLSRLGVRATADENVMTDVRWLRNVVTRTAVEFDDWTVDGEPLRNLVPPSSGGDPPLRTFVTAEVAYWPSAVESLRALLGEDAQSDDSGVRFEDGRLGLLFCSSCGALDCYTLSASIERGEKTVEWRDIAYQVAYESLDLSDQTPFSITFDRVEYEAEVSRLLRTWIANVEQADGL